MADTLVKKVALAKAALQNTGLFIILDTLQLEPEHKEMVCKLVSVAAKHDSNGVRIIPHGYAVDDTACGTDLAHISKDAETSHRPKLREIDVRTSDIEAVRGILDSSQTDCVTLERRLGDVLMSLTEDLIRCRSSQKAAVIFVTGSQASEEDWYQIKRAVHPVARKLGENPEAIDRLGLEVIVMEGDDRTQAVFRNIVTEVVAKECPGIMVRFKALKEIAEGRHEEDVEVLLAAAVCKEPDDEDE